MIIYTIYSIKTTIKYQNVFYEPIWKRLETLPAQRNTCMADTYHNKGKKYSVTPPLSARPFSRPSGQGRRREATKGTRCGRTHSVVRTDTQEAVDGHTGSCGQAHRKLLTDTQETEKRKVFRHNYVRTLFVQSE